MQPAQATPTLASSWPLASQQYRGLPAAIYPPLPVIAEAFPR